MRDTEKLSNPAGPSLAAIKRLFALSGNKCAFPKCQLPLVDGRKVVGRVCHIKARHPGGPRYDANQTVEQRHAYENLILLCGRHHDVVDDDEDAYTVEYLERLKARHEQTATKLSEEQVEQGATLLLLDQSVSSTNQSGGITAYTVHVHNYAQSDTKTIDQRPTGFSAVEARDGSARFRTPDQALGMFWDLMPFARSREYEVFLAKGPAMWLRVMPSEFVSEQWGHDELLRCGRGPKITFQLLVWSNLQYLRAPDGIGVYATIDNLKQETETRSVAFAFCTGEVWCVDTTLLQMTQKRHLCFIDIARALIQKFRGYTVFLECLGIRPPFQWIAGLDGVKGWRLKVPPPPNHVSTSSGETCLTNVVEGRGVFEMEQSTAMTLRPFFDQLFRKCGTRIPDHIEEAIRTRTHLNFGL